MGVLGAIWDRASERFDVEELVVLHVQGFLGFGSLLLGAVTYNSIALRQVQMEGNERAVLHAQSPQGGAVNLMHTHR